MAQFTVLSYWRSYSHFKVVVVILIVIGLLHHSEGLRMCYSCDTSGGNLECVHNPSNVTDGETSCKGYCTIRRQEYVNMPQGASLVSLERKCEVSPPNLDEVFVDGHFKYYHRSCKNYLCNVGSGIHSLRDMPIDPAWDLYTDEDSGGNKVSRNMSPYRLLQILALLLSIFN